MGRKIISSGDFKWHTDKIAHEKTWTWLRNRNLKSENESLLITTQNNVININYIKAKIDNTQQNCKYRLCVEKYEKYVIGYSKLVWKEYHTRHDWVGKVIHEELCKRLKFEHTSKWYMHNLKSVLEDKTHKILFYFEIQTDHLISARRPDLALINKESICHLMDIGVKEKKTKR